MSSSDFYRPFDFLRDPEYGVNQTRAYIREKVPAGAYWSADIALRKLWSLALEGPVAIEVISSEELKTVRVQVKELPTIQFGFMAPQPGARHDELNELRRIMRANGVPTVVH